MTILAYPAKADTLEKNFNTKFKAGSQAASATAIVPIPDYPEDAYTERMRAEEFARWEAEKKYSEEFHEPIDWPSASVLVTHRDLDVTVYINVEMS